MVSVTVTLPDGSKVNIQENTNLDGKTVFKIRGVEPGIYSSAVTSVSKDGWVYNIEANIESGDVFIGALIFIAFGFQWIREVTGESISEVDMSSSTFRVLFSLFLIAHGLVTIRILVPAPKTGTQRSPFLPSWRQDDGDESWPITRLRLPSTLIRAAGWAIWAGIMAGFLTAGLGLLGVPGLSQIWQLLALAAATLSVILLVLFWRPWDIVGLILNIGILAGIFFGWFTSWFS